MRVILLLGAPGSGKTTQGKLLADSYENGVFVSTGQVIREALAKSESDMSEAERILASHVKAGTFAPASVTDSVFAARFSAPDVQSASHLFIDGYPRAHDQIEPAAALLARCSLPPLDTVLYLEVSPETSLARIQSRNQSGEKRADDAAAQGRVERFFRDVAPLVAHFETEDLLGRVDGGGTVEEVKEDAVKMVESLGRGKVAQRPSAAERMREKLVESGVVGMDEVERFRDQSLQENAHNRTGAMRRFVYLITSNLIKHQEYTKMFSTYGMEVLRVAPLSEEEWTAAEPKADRSRVDESGLPPFLEDPTKPELEALFIRQLLACSVSRSLIPFAVMKEESVLLAPSLTRKSTMRHGVRVVNKAVMRVWRRLPKEKKIIVINYEGFTEGTIDRTRADPTDPTVFGWDDVFIPKGTHLTFHELKQRGLKVAARQGDIADFLVDWIHYKQGRDLKWNPQNPKRSVDFSIDPVNVVLAHKWPVEPYVIAALNQGMYFRFPFNRRHANYFQTQVAGLPATPKSDALHEYVFQMHDIGHLVIQELCYTGNNSYLHRAVFIAVRMLSEAMTMILADMFVVDGLKRSGVEYDWTKRKIYPLFEAIGVPLDDPETRLDNLLSIMQANANCLLKGDDSTYRELIEKNGGDLSALDNFKKKYGPFFTSDFTWAIDNYRHLTKIADPTRRWWATSKPLRDASGLLFESIDDFLGAIELEERCDPSDLIDKVLRFLFERQLRPILSSKDVEVEPRWQRLQKAGARYFVGQLALFSHFFFVDGAQEEQQKVVDYALAMLKTRDEKDVLDWIAKARTVVEEFLDRLVSYHLISKDDCLTYREQFPLMPVSYLSYDQDPDAYEGIDKIFAREFDVSVRFERMMAEYEEETGCQIKSKAARNFYRRMVTLIEGSGGNIDNGTFVTRPGLLLLASSSPDSTFSHPATMNVSFLIAGASVETSMEFVAHGEARVARLTSSRTSSMNYPLFRVAQHHDPESQKAYFRKVLKRRAMNRQLLIPEPEKEDEDSPIYGRGRFEICNNAAPASKVSAFMITMSVADWHKTLLGRASRAGNEADVVYLARAIADQLHSKYPDHVWPSAAYATAENTEKYKAARAQGASTQPTLPKEDLSITSELVLTAGARRVFKELNLNESQPRTDTDRISEFAMRITYLSFPNSPDYDAKAYLEKLVVGTGHLSVVGCSRVNIVHKKPLSDAVIAFLKDRTDGKTTTLEGGATHLSFSVKHYTSLLNAADADTNTKVQKLGQDLRQLLQEKYGMYLLR